MRRVGSRQSRQGKQGRRAEVAGGLAGWRRKRLWGRARRELSLSQLPAWAGVRVNGLSDVVVALWACMGRMGRMGSTRQRWWEQQQRGTSGRFLVRAAGDEVQQSYPEAATVGPERLAWFG